MASRVGTRVRLTSDIERYPYFIAPAGAVGTVTQSDEELVAVRLDRPLAGAEEWDNEVHWYPRNCGDVPTDDFEALPWWRRWTRG